MTTLRWKAPVHVAGSTNAQIHVSECGRFAIVQNDSPIAGEPPLFEISESMKPDAVHPTLSSLDEAKDYAEKLAGAR